MEILLEQISDATELQFPAAAALAYAISELSLHPPGYFDDDEYDDYDTVDPVTGY